MTQNSCLYEGGRAPTPGDLTWRGRFHDFVGMVDVRVVDMDFQSGDFVNFCW